MKINHLAGNSYTDKVNLAQMPNPSQQTSDSVQLKNNELLSPNNKLTSDTLTLSKSEPAMPKAYNYTDTGKSYLAGNQAIGNTSTPPNASTGANSVASDPKKIPTASNIQLESEMDEEFDDIELDEDEEDDM